MHNAVITAVGTHTPPGRLTNQDLERMVDTNDAWIRERTGIRERRIAVPEVATSDMAVLAAQDALARRGLDASELDAILVCTVTADMTFPATACLVQDRLGARRAWGFDLVAACSGFVYGLGTAAQLVRAGMHERVLVVGADTMSRIIDYTDRATCILFGDGAGAMLVERGPDGDAGAGFIGYRHEVDGSGGPALCMPAGGSRLPASADTVAGRQHFVKQDGQQVFKYAVRKMHEVCAELLEQHGLTAADVSLLVPHQANLRIITGVAERLGVPMERVVVNIDRYGNTTAATIPLATREALDAGRLTPGDLVLFAAVGAGYTVGASLWRWSA